MDEENLEKKVIIPYKDLSKDALSGVIQEFILREGTDYGVQEQTYASKENRVISQLESGYIAVVYDPVLESCNLVKSEDLYSK